MTSIGGVIPYLVTPLTDDGVVKADVLKALCTDLIECGVHGLTPLGSTGEYAYLDNPQKQRVVEVVVEATEDRVPVIPGVAGVSTQQAVERAKAYEALGVNGIVAVLDAYFPLTDVDVERYFLAIADAVNVPVILYTNPNFQRANLSIDVIEKLSRHQNIVGLKDASSNTGRLLSIRNRCGDNLQIYAASSHIGVSVMLMGGKGWFSGPACAIPRQSVRLYNLCIQRQWDDAMELQRSLWSFNELFARFNLAACMKAALHLQGYDVGRPIAPQSPIEEQGRLLIASCLRQLQAGGLGEVCTLPA